MSEVLLVFEVSGKERDSKEYDWGFGNAFDGPSRPHHRLDKQYWNSVKNTEVCCNRLMCCSPLKDTKVGYSGR